MNELKNKNIIFIANGGKEWIGGLYYVKNIVYTLIEENKITPTTKVYILAQKENVELFKSLLKYNNVIIVNYNNSQFNKIFKKITSKVFHKVLDLELINKVKRLNIDYIYPVNSYSYMLLKDKCIFWIPDFQHIHLPEMFSQSEIDSRNKVFEYMAKNHKNLILSSEDSFNDYKSLYPNETQNVYVLSFKSYIEDDIKDIDNAFINSIIKKYHLPDKFIFLPNQFWKHKNHITVFKAIDYIVNNRNKDICLVCTGNTSDYRNKDHFYKLEEFIKTNKLENNIRILGFISRKDQLALMKASVAVIQPSLFEGWGTVVEDAKTLNKKIIMSDIEVHYEQKNEDCILFERYNYKQLGKIICNVY